jgi:hypothetical protein
MSLINDARKKAARQRAQEDADLGNLMPGGGHQGARRPEGSRKQLYILIGGAIITVSVLSAVLTGIYVGGRSTPAPAPSPSPAPVQPSAAAKPAASPVVTIQVPVAAAKPPPAAVVVAAPVPTDKPRAALPPAPSPTPVPVVVATPPPAVAPVATPAVAAPVVAASAPTQAPAAAVTVSKPVPVSDQIQAYIDGLHVAGARPSANGGKAIIDGHIFRVNDVLDHALGVRLVKVEADKLTFQDHSGAVYTKVLD